MNYKEHYDNLIFSRKCLNRSKQNGIYEKHHIIPRSLGGSNEKENLILLTPKEHFVAHLLLTQMYSGKEKAKMCNALLRMCSVSKFQNRKITARQYDFARSLYSESVKGENNPMYKKEPWNKNTKGICKSNTGTFVKGHKTYNKGLTKETSLSIKTASDKMKGHTFNNKSVLQFNFSGELLAEWPSLKIAAAKTRTNKCSISLCCSGKLKKANNFKWKYK